MFLELLHLRDPGVLLLDETDLLEDSDEVLSDPEDSDLDIVNPVRQRQTQQVVKHEYSDA